MAAPEDMLPLTKVSSEVDDSQSKIIFSIQCIKAQEDLCNKLKQEIKRREERWYFMKKDNQKLETEIKNAENEIKCSSTAIEAIRCSNVELRKELLLTKETYVDYVQRVKDGEKKYDTMWLEAKQRFEGIPFVQEWMKATQQVDSLHVRLDVLEHEALMLHKEKRQKKRQVLAEERKLILNLAEFLNGYNAPIKAIKDKQEEVAKLAKEVEALKAEQNAKSAPSTANGSMDPLMSKLTLKPVEESDSKIVDENWMTLCRNIYDDSLMMPKLQPSTMDKDALNVKLNLKKPSTQVTSITRTISISVTESLTKRVQPDESLDEQYISCYFSKPAIATNGENTDTTSEYSKKKLINILDDIQLDDNDTYDIIAKTNPDHLQVVSVIGADTLHKKNGKESPKNDKGPIVSEEIEEIDLTAGNGNSQKLLMPPSQFADINEESYGRKTQEDASTGTLMVKMSVEQNVDGAEKDASNVKKRVSFDIPMSTEHDISDDMGAGADNDAYKLSETVESITSEGENANDDTFMNMREMLLKKHALDLSPQFVYGKNAIKKTTDENVVTSKFFETKVEANDKQTHGNTNNKSIELEEVPGSDKAAADEKQCTAQTQQVDNEHSVDVDGDNMKSPPEERPVAGMLFTHGPQGIPDCLDISMSTTGYEEGDIDFPQYLATDSSLLMSPKADHDMPPMSLSGNPPGVESQEVPNFLSGFKKAGLSFFKSSPETSTDANAQKQENNFNFNFGGSSEEKKNKGLFSFFR